MNRVCLTTRLHKVANGMWPCHNNVMMMQVDKHGRNFQNIASKTNQRWVITYDKPLIHFGTDILKIVAVLVFFNGS